MEDAFNKLAQLAELQKEATPGPWLLTTINTNPRGLRNYKQVVRATDTGILGGLPVPKITMQLTFDGYGEMEMQSDGTPDGYWPTTETKRNATFIATAGSTDFADLLRAVQCLQQSEHQAAEENLRLKEQLATIRMMATRSMPTCINLQAIDRVLNAGKEPARA